MVDGPSNPSSLRFAGSNVDYPIRRNMLPGKLLYRGDNGVHEFWESEDHELLILRNHGESYWTAHRNHGFLFGCRSAIEAANRLKVELSPLQIWIQKNGKFGEFMLEASPESLAPAGKTTSDSEEGVH
jgi:hypothetical protein